MQLDPDMPAQEMRLHMGEMTAQEMRTARAAIRWANSVNRRAPSPSPAPGVVEAAKAVLANWDERLVDGPEAYKTSFDLDFSYWSPAASMVASEHMAALRAALASLSQPAKGEPLPKDTRRFKKLSTVDDDVVHTEPYRNSEPGKSWAEAYAPAKGEREGGAK